MLISRAVNSNKGNLLQNFLRSRGREVQMLNDPCPHCICPARDDILAEGTYLALL